MYSALCAIASLFDYFWQIFFLSVFILSIPCYRNKPCSFYVGLLIYVPCIVTFQLLADLENSSMFADDLECQKLLMEAMKYHLLPERRSMLQSPRTKPRKSTVGALYAVGGMDAAKGKINTLINWENTSIWKKEERDISNSLHVIRRLLNPC